jgi:hypothetical protein
MKKWFLASAGFFVGVCFAGWSLLENQRPPACQFLQAPPLYFFEYLDRHTRPSGLGALAVIIPLWLIYWGSLGALVGFVPRLVSCLLGILRRHEPCKPDKSEIAFCVGIGLIILVVILICLFRAYFPPKPSGLPVYQGP